VFIRRGRVRYQWLSVTGYSVWNFPVAVLLVLAACALLISRRVVVGPSFVSRCASLGHYRVALAEASRPVR
jgi:acyl-CoA reductase-like NAD-dependent aldehyde dehydrogenase